MSSLPHPTLLPNPGIGSKDPQVAAGRDYVLAIDSGRLWLYDRAAKTSLSRTATELFKGLFPKVNAFQALPPNICEPNVPQHNSGFTPEHPNAVIPGNIDSAYDTRVFYEPVGGNFWIASALRHPLWPCAKVTIPGLVVEYGVATCAPGPDCPKPDPSPGDPKTAVCHTDWAVTPRRFIAVAVSKGEHALDLDDAHFYRYVLVDEYADWPQMSVDQNYLVLNHRSSRSTTYVFDARHLARGTDADSVMKVAPLAMYSSQELTDTLKSPLFPHEGPGEFAADSGVAILPVNSHGDTDGLTFLIGGAWNLLLVFAFDKNPQTGKPRLLAGTSVAMGFSYGHPQCNAVYQGGHLHLTFSFEAPTVDVGDYGNLFDPFDRRAARIVQVAVRRASSKTALEADSLWSRTFGGREDDALSYVNPCIDLTSRGDMVVAYDRVGLRAATTAASARVSVKVTGEPEFRPGAALHDAGALPAGVQVPDPSKGTLGIDLPGIAQDPASQHAVWVAHAYGTGTPEAGNPMMSSDLVAIVGKVATA